MAKIIGQDLVKKVLELFTEELNRFAHEYNSECPQCAAFMVQRCVYGVAQLVERQTQDPKTRGSNPACVRSTRKNVESFSESKMLC